MKSESGTYALVLRSRATAEIQVGRWGALGVKPSYYIYVGSAFGPGGVQARVLRHCREEKTKHWHIDYLREVVEPIGAWYRYGDKRLEHKWAQSITGMVDISAIKGFGSSDCKCYSHLFITKRKPSFALFSGAVGGGVESWLYYKLADMEQTET